jgi:hypothetical protein
MSGLLAYTLAGVLVGHSAVHAQDREGFAATPDGTGVVDLSARLIWARCVVGMSWNGKTCTGQPVAMDRAQARLYAQERWQAEGVDWRLPRVPELVRLYDKGAKPPGVNPVWFPNAPADWHWTSTANVHTGTRNPYNYSNVMRSQGGGADNLGLSQGWAVNLRTGQATGDADKESKLSVRLVRSLPASAAP